MEIMIFLYILVATDVYVGLVTDNRNTNGIYHISVVLIGSAIISVLWPIYFAAKIVQKL